MVRIRGWSKLQSATMISECFSVLVVLIVLACFSELLRGFGGFIGYGEI